MLPGTIGIEYPQPAPRQTGGRGARGIDLAIEKAPEQLTLAPQEAFQLGATTLAASDGIERVRRWFEERSRPAA